MDPAFACGSNDSSDIVVTEIFGKTIQSIARDNKVVNLRPEMAVSEMLLSPSAWRVDETFVRDAQSLSVQHPPY